MVEVANKEITEHLINRQTMVLHNRLSVLSEAQSFINLSDTQKAESYVKLSNEISKSISSSSGFITRVSILHESNYPFTYLFNCLILGVALAPLIIRPRPTKPL